MVNVHSLISEHPELTSRLQQITLKLKDSFHAHLNGVKPHKLTLSYAGEQIF